jgi:hypothetical protein
VPNHVCNVLKFHYHKDSGEKIQAIKAYLAGPDSALDFERIMPPPDFPHEEIAPGLVALSDEEYEWCCANWGTKWNAYDVRVRVEGDWKLCIDFQTAWHWPEPIIRKIMADWPDVAIVHVAAIEGCCGAIHQKRDDEGLLERTEWQYSPANAHVIYALREALNMSY